MFSHRALSKITVTYDLASIVVKIFLIDALRKLNFHYKEFMARSLDKKGKPKSFLSKIYDRRLSRITYETSEILDEQIETFYELLPRSQGKQVQKITEKILLFPIPNVLAISKNWDRKIRFLKLLFEHESSKNRLKLLLGDVLYRPIKTYINSDQKLEDSVTLVARVKKLTDDKDIIGLCGIVVKTINKIDVRLIDNVRKSSKLSEDAGNYLQRELEGNKAKKVAKKSAITPETHPGYFTKEKPYKLLWKPIPDKAEDLEFNNPTKNKKTGKWSWYAKWIDPNSNNEVTTYLQEHFEENKKENFNTVRKFKQGYNKIKSNIKKFLGSSNALDRILALMVHLVDTGYFRIGNKLSEKEDVRGLAYLQVRHVKEIKGDFITFSYIAKKQMEDTITIKVSSRVMKIFKSLLKGKGSFDYIFTTKNGEPIGEGAVNRFLKNNLGGKKYGASIHKFRHIATTKMFEDEIANNTPPGFERWKIVDRVQWYKDQLEKIRVAIRHDSIATTLNSYIDPKVVKDFDKKYGFEGLSMTAGNPLTGIKKFLLQMEDEKGYVDSDDITEAKKKAEKAKLLKEKGVKPKKKVTIKKTIQPEEAVKRKKKKITIKKKPEKLKIKLKKPTKKTIKRVKIAKNKTEVSEKIKNKKRAILKFKKGGKIQKHDIYFFDENDLDELEAELNKIEGFVKKFATPKTHKLPKLKNKTPKVSTELKQRITKIISEGLQTKPYYSEDRFKKWEEEEREKEEAFTKLWDAMDKANAMKNSQEENAEESLLDEEPDDLAIELEAALANCYAPGEEFNKPLFKSKKPIIKEIESKYLDSNSSIKITANFKDDGSTLELMCSHLQNLSSPNLTNEDRFKFSKYAVIAAKKIKIKKKEHKKPKIKIVRKKKLEITEEVLKEVLERIPSTHIKKAPRQIRIAKKKIDVDNKRKKLYDKMPDILKPVVKEVKPKVKTPQKLLEKSGKKLTIKIAKKLEKKIKDKAKKTAVGVKETIVEMKSSLKKYNTLVPTLIGDYQSFFSPHNIDNKLAIKIKWDTFEEGTYAGEFLLYLDKSNWLKAIFHKGKSKWFIVDNQVFGIPDKMIRTHQFSDSLMISVIRRLIGVIQEELGEIEEEKPALHILAKELKEFHPIINEQENKLFISGMSLKPIVNVLESRKWIKMHVPERTYIGIRENKTRLLMQKGNLYLTLLEIGSVFPNTEIYLSIA